MAEDVFGRCLSEINEAYLPHLKSERSVSNGVNEV